MYYVNLPIADIIWRRAAARADFFVARESFYRKIPISILICTTSIFWQYQVIIHDSI